MDDQSTPDPESKGDAPSASPVGVPSARGADPDRTTVLRPQVPGPQVPGSALSEATAIVPPGAAVSARLEDAGQAASARWSGKAYVPSRPPRDPDATAQWQPPEPGRAWWLPVLFAIIALIVLVAGAFVLVTTLSDDDGGGGVQPTSSATPSATRSQPAATPPTSNPPTSAAPTMPTAAGTFTVPATLIGLPIADAKTILDGYGIAYTAVPQTNDSALPNTVVSTLPGAGQVVPDGGAVTLYYAQPSAPSTPATSTPTGSSSPTG